MDIVISLIGGLGLFLFGMNYMGDGLQKAAGEKMKNILAVLTKNKFLGLLVGTLVTMVIQSSSATTVMTVGFVNAGLMNLQQAIGIIMGANIGTTVTGFLVSLSIDKLAPLFIGIGVFVYIATKKKKVKDAAQIIIGFGILFLGMDLMKNAVNPLKNSPVFIDVLSNLENPVLGIFAGFAITALLQSSSATTGLLIAVAASGCITIDMAFPILFGQNIGTCVTALLSSIGANKVAKRASVMHLLFNVIGTAIFLIFLAKPVSLLVVNLVKTDIKIQIAVAHILFNIINVVILFPFSNLIVKAATFLVKGDDDIIDDNIKYIDTRLLATPSVALAQASRETLRLGKIVTKQLEYSIEALINRDENIAKKVFEIERQVNLLNSTILNYVVKVDKVSLNYEEEDKVAKLFNILNDIERVGDHADNIAELAIYMYENNVSYSDYARKELEQLIRLTLDVYKNSINVIKSADKEIGNQVITNDHKIDASFKALRKNHIQRLNDRVCEPSAGIIFLDVINNLERIGDHASNIAITMIEGFGNN
ncbi:Na/Pi cotransporter family protein [Sedimentibacter sp. zth1]|uniref:Na/Pi cotransporter family protein n=1 Tax=Sedimentibacter sp. zth1 TaxID=2816908 RepID=UPI001A9294B3|nr:Na/Pi cotransporter family protein [Sedimentibacter sp. zth1]QSX06220.1 Na/Pi cotransporter family protein [Sedimentibacter sp. zth1]